MSRSPASQCAEPGRARFHGPFRSEKDLLEKCSSKPLLVFSASVMKSSHRLLDVLFSVTPSNSVRLNTPSRRAESCPHFSFLTGTLIQKATALEATEECWPGLPSGVFQTPHCSLRPKYLPLEWVRVSPFFFFFFFGK